MQRAISKRVGFTIIETMLVLAISGALVVGLLVGTGTSINSQRYRDSIVSLHSLLQDQYSRLTSIQNDRSDDWTCNDGQVVEAEAGGTGRGQSDCVFLGRFVIINDSDVAIASIVGAGETAGVTGSDLAIIASNYRMGLVASSIETSQLEWNVRLAWPTTGDETGSMPRHIAIFYLRSPVSGQTYTFTSDTIDEMTDVTDASLQAMLTDDAQKARTLCVDSNGLVWSGNLSVVIQAHATGPNSIETSSNEVLAEQGAVRC